MPIILTISILVNIIFCIFMWDEKRFRKYGLFIFIIDLFNDNYKKYHLTKLGAAIPAAISCILMSPLIVVSFPMIFLLSLFSKLKNQIKDVYIKIFYRKD